MVAATGRSGARACIRAVDSLYGATKSYLVLRNLGRIKHELPRTGDMRHSDVESSLFYDMFPGTEPTPFLEGLTTNIDWLRGYKPRWLSLAAARRMGILAVGGIAALFVGLDAAVAVKAKSSGPVLLRQTRAGLNADHFECSKFRAMPYGNNPLIPDASRITSASK